MNVLSPDERSKKEKKEILRRMAGMAAVDGELSQSELERMAHIARERLGVEPEDWTEWVPAELEKLNEQDFGAKASTVDDAIFQLYDLIEILVADRKTDKHEIDYLEAAAGAIGFKHERLRELLLAKLTLYGENESSELLMIDARLEAMWNKAMGRYESESADEMEYREVISAMRQQIPVEIEGKTVPFNVYILAENDAPVDRLETSLKDAGFAVETGLDRSDFHQHLPTPEPSRWNDHLTVVMATKEVALTEENANRLRDEVIYEVGTIRRRDEEAWYFRVNGWDISLPPDITGQAAQTSDEDDYEPTEEARAKFRKLLGERGVPMMAVALREDVAAALGCAIEGRHMFKVGAPEIEEIERQIPGDGPIQVDGALWDENPALAAVKAVKDGLGVREITVSGRSVSLEDSDLGRVNTASTQGATVEFLCHKLKEVGDDFPVTMALTVDGSDVYQGACLPNSLDDGVLVLRGDGVIAGTARTSAIRAGEFRELFDEVPPHIELRIVFDTQQGVFEGEVEGAFVPPSGDVLLIHGEAHDRTQSDDPPQGL